MSLEVRKAWLGWPWTFGLQAYQRHLGMAKSLRERVQRGEERAQDMFVRHSSTKTLHR